VLSELLRLSGRDLMERLRGGHPVDPAAIADREYRGVSLGLPKFVERLTWKTFKKVFCRDDDGIRGWNVRMEQNGLDGPWHPKTRRGVPVTFGHFAVSDARDRTPPGCDRGLLLDYGLGGGPLGLLRDPIVALEEGSAELLLGWSYLAMGRRHLGTPSFFALLADGPLSHRVASPRATKA
jgi:hypothetical protein